jgi:hypothetical protein
MKKMESESKGNKKKDKREDDHVFPLFKKDFYLRGPVNAAQFDIFVCLLRKQRILSWRNRKP